MKGIAHMSAPVVRQMKRWLAQSQAAPTGVPAGEAALFPPSALIDRYAALHEEFAASLHSMFGTRLHAAELIKHAVDGSIKLLDAVTLAEVIGREKPQKILEVGSFLGFSTRWLLECTSRHGSRVTSLDPRVRHRIFDDVKSHVESFCRPHAERLTCVDGYFCARNDDMFFYDYVHYEPRLSREEALRVLARVPVIDRAFDRFDMAFIDGDHGFAATVLNVHLAATMLPTGGVIVVHDAISWPEVRPALAALCGPGGAGGGAGAGAGAGAGLQLEGIAGDHFRRRYGHVPDIRHLTDGLGIVRVTDPQAAAAFDPSTLLARM